MGNEGLVAGCDGIGGHIAGAMAMGADGWVCRGIPRDHVAETGGAWGAAGVVGAPAGVVAFTAGVSTRRGFLVGRAVASTGVPSDLRVVTK